MQCKHGLIRHRKIKVFDKQKTTADNDSHFLSIISTFLEENVFLTAAGNWCVAIGRSVNHPTLVAVDQPRAEGCVGY